MLEVEAGSSLSRLRIDKRLPHLVSSFLLVGCGFARITLAQAGVPVLLGEFGDGFAVFAGVGGAVVYARGEVAEDGLAAAY